MQKARKGSSPITTINGNSQTTNLNPNYNSNIPSGDFTPNISSQMQPTIRFSVHEEGSLSNSLEQSSPDNTCDSRQVKVPKLESISKAAKMIERTIGQTNELDKFDTLRAIMKNRMHMK